MKSSAFFFQGKNLLVCAVYKNKIEKTKNFVINLELKSGFALSEGILVWNPVQKVSIR